MELSRRSFFAGLGSFIAAPAIVQATSLMPVTAPPLIAARQILTLSMITREAIRMFVNGNAFISEIDRQWQENFRPPPALQRRHDA